MTDGACAAWWLDTAYNVGLYGHRLAHGLADLGVQVIQLCGLRAPATTPYVNVR